MSSFDVLERPGDRVLRLAVQHLLLVALALATVLGLLLGGLGTLVGGPGLGVVAVLLDLLYAGVARLATSKGL